MATPTSTQYKDRPFALVWLLYNLRCTMTIFYLHVHRRRHDTSGLNQRNKSTQLCGEITELVGEIHMEPICVMHIMCFTDFHRTLEQADRGSII